MDQDDIKGLKYYIIYCLALMAFFIFSGMTGWKWVNDTETEPTRSATSTRPGFIYRYHK